MFLGNWSDTCGEHDGNNRKKNELTGARGRRTDKMNNNNLTNRETFSLKIVCVDE